MTVALPLVGRQRELAELQRHLAAAAAGNGGLVLLGGEAGIGKTALLQAALAAAGPLRTVVGRSLGPGETPPFGPWLEAVAELAVLACCDAAGLPPPFGSAPDDWTAAEVARALVNWMATAGPVALALEDVHWADPASLELLRHAAPRLSGTPVLVVATYRTDELHRNHPLWRLLPDLQRAGAERVLPERLTPAAVQELVAAAIPNQPEAAGLAPRLHQRTGGNPLFVRELLDAAIRTGTAAGAETPLPETVQQAIDRSLARLRPGTLTVLQAAAVIGERFSYDLLARVADLPEDDLVAALEEAMNLHAVRSEGSAGDQFAFDHALVREVLVGRLIGPRRRRWHQRVAEALLAQPTPDPDAVALHLDRAGDPRAAEYQMAAADRALRLGALVQAEQLYERALELAPEDDPRRGELLLKLGRSVRFDDQDRARAYWEEALRAAEAAGDRPVLVWSQHMLALWHLWKDDPRSVELMEQVQAEEERILGDARYQRLEQDLLGHVTGYPRIAAARALVLAVSSRFEAARAVTEEMRARALPGSLQLELRNVERIVAWLSGRLEEAVEHCRLMAEEALLIRNYRLALNAETNRLFMMMRCQADRPDEADAVARRLAELEAESRVRAGYALAEEGFSALGFYQFLRGDWAGARHNLLDYLLRHPEELSGGFRWFAAQLQLAQGDAAGALATVSATPPRRPEDDPGFGDAGIHVLAHCTRAHIYLAQGDAERARAWLESADRWLSLRTMVPDWTLVRIAWAAYHRHAGNRPEAARAAREGLTHAAGMHDSWTMGQVHRILGELAAEEGQAGEAGRQFEQALDLAERCRFPYEVALAQLARGQALPGAAGAREGLLAARDTFARLGAAPALTAAEAALARAAGTVPARAAEARTGEAGGDTAGAAEGSPATAPPPLPEGLTEREVEVVRLVARGLTDKEVAAQLYISPRTVDGHLRHIFNKVGVSSRTALAAFAARHGLVD